MPVHWQKVERRHRRHLGPQTWVIGRDNKQYQVPIPRKSGWTPNAPLRKGDSWLPSPREKGATENIKREEETAAMKKEREKREAKAKENKKRQLRRSQISREKAQMRERIEDVAVVQFVPKAGENLFRSEVHRPPKESPDIQFFRKLNELTAKERKVMFKKCDEMF